jgi:hypothetical protein
MLPSLDAKTEIPISEEVPMVKRLGACVVLLGAVACSGGNIAPTPTTGSQGHPLDSESV